jgi:hypothetical protein
MPVATESHIPFNRHLTLMTSIRCLGVRDITFTATSGFNDIFDGTLHSGAGLLLVIIIIIITTTLIATHMTDRIALWNTEGGALTLDKGTFSNLMNRASPPDLSCYVSAHLQYMPSSSTSPYPYIV